MPSEQPSTANPTPDIPRRLDRLEESQGYSERMVELLSAEIADMNKRVQVMGKRLAALEVGLSKLQAGGEEGEEGK